MTMTTNTTTTSSTGETQPEAGFHTTVLAEPMAAWLRSIPSPSTISALLRVGAHVRVKKSEWLGGPDDLTGARGVVTAIGRGSARVLVAAGDPFASPGEYCLTARELTVLA